MADSTQDSDRIMANASRSLQTNREGGYHRRGGSIGEGSKKLKSRHLGKKIRNIVLAIGAIFVAASVAGLVIDGLGFVGVMVTFLALIGAVVFFSSRKIKLPQMADLSQEQDARRLVARTELWLENQRPALPPPAVKLVDDIGVQLDALGMQLEHIDAAHPAAGETRKLVGEYLPDMIHSYRKIPDHLRREERIGSTPEKQLIDGLGKISGEIDQVTRKLAEGSLDDLAIRTRYLDYKFGDADETKPE